MKTIKGTITLMLIIFCSSFSEAQQVYVPPARTLEIHKKDIESSQYIFEGKVIRYSSMKYAAVTCFLIQINKIYKGSPELKLGTIKVIIEANEQTTDMGSSFLRKGYTYILLGNPYNTHIYDSIATDNTIVLTYSDPVVLQGKGADWNFTHYNTRDSLYSFFRENGLTVQEQAPEADSAKH